MNIFFKITIGAKKGASSNEYNLFISLRYIENITIKRGRKLP